MKLGRTLLLGGLVLAPAIAHAQPFRGVYLGGAAGIHFMGEESIDSSSALGLPSGRAAFSNGFVGLGSVGYGFGNGLRVELEGSWRDNPLHAVLRPNDPTAAAGRQTATAVMANTLFDLDVRSRWIFPYIGAGLGYAWTRWHGVEAAAPGSLYTASGTSGNFAFQAMFGLSFPVPHVPGLSFTAEYRFFDVPGSLTFPSTYRAGTHLSSGNTVLHFDHSQSFLIGVRYAFGVTPP